MGDRAGTDSTVAIALLYPDLLGTYGDGGNAVVLERRLAWRGIDATIVQVMAGEPVPATCQLYVLGGGEDAPQTQAARELGVDGPLHDALQHGAVLLAVCAGMQIAGHSFPGADDTTATGLGVLACHTERSTEPRAVGELLARPMARDGEHHPLLDVDRVGALTGFENHAARTHRLAGAQPLGIVEAGVGNGDGTEGVVGRFGDGYALGTYLHGPALARNPGLADQLLVWATGTDLEPIDDPEVAALRQERLETVRRGHLDGVAKRSWRDRILNRS